MRLPHLLIPVAVTLPALFLVIWFLSRVGLDPGREKVLVPAVGLVLWFAGLPLYWPICKRLGIPPLLIFAPGCPHCHARPGGWWCVERQMPKKGRSPERVILACGLCEKRVELWLRRRVAAGAITGSRPAYRLRWPEFLGIWRRLPENEKTNHAMG
jgi:hypothetical protein